MDLSEYFFSRLFNLLPYKKKSISTFSEISLSVFVFLTSSIYSVKNFKINKYELIPIKPTKVYVMDKGFIDFKRLYSLNLLKAFFITRSKINLVYRRIYSSNFTEYKNIICDQIIKLTDPLTSKLYQEILR
jgi:hypothetical protein